MAILLRTVLLLALLKNCESGESLELVNVHNYNRALLNSQDSSSSAENSVRRHTKHSNAIVRARVNGNSNFDFASSATKSDCPSCGERKNAATAELPDAILRSMRLEMIKQQILKKLRLSEPPKPPKNYHSNVELPAPIVSGGTLHKAHESQNNRDVEDFYGKTEQIIVFPEISQDPEKFLDFKLPRDIRYEEIGSVELWTYLDPSAIDSNDGARNQSIVLSQILPSSSSSSTSSSDEYEDDYSNSNDLDVRHGVKLIPGWLSLNLSFAATHWLKSGDYQQRLQLECKSCRKNSQIFGSEGEERPFIVFNMAGAVKKSRSRRYINCSPGVRECCRERFVVNFSEIGWDWVIGPRVYESFYCKGSCLHANSLRSSASRRNTIIVAYLNGNSKNVSDELIPCCTPTKMSSISLIYQTWPDNSTTPTTITEVLPNMVVESCGCL